MVGDFDVVRLGRNPQLYASFSGLGGLDDIGFRGVLGLGEGSEAFLDLGQNLLWRERPRYDQHSVSRRIVSPIVFEQIVSGDSLKVRFCPTLRPPVRMVSERGKE